jgi:hypothetical protein
MEFDLFWYESVASGVACFYRWLGKVRATVLVVLDGDCIRHIECCGVGGDTLPAVEAEPIVEHVARALHASRQFPKVQ